MKKFATLLLCTLLSAVVFAQTASMLSMARGEIERRGLTEAEVRVRLMENGIDVDSIPPTEYPQYKDRVVAVLNQMQAEKTPNVPASAAAGTPVSVGENVPAIVVTAESIPQTTAGEAAAEKPW